DEVLAAINLDFLSGVLPEQHRVVRLHIERRDLAVLLDAALADRDDFALLRLFLRGVRDDDAADLLFALVDALDDDAVVQWSHLHDCPFPRGGKPRRDVWFGPRGWQS